jgi:hypothetical protein
MIKGDRIDSYNYVNPRLATAKKHPTSGSLAQYLFVSI